MQGSIGSVGDALDNALMESKIVLYGRIEVERETAYWVKWFNDERLHSVTDYEEMYRSNLATEPQAA